MVEPQTTRPCQQHDSNFLRSYGRAKEKMARGERQSMCATCGLYVWRDERCADFRKANK